MKLRYKILLAAVLLPAVPSLISGIIAHQELIHIARAALRDNDPLLATHIGSLWQKQGFLISLTAAIFLVLGVVVAARLGNDISRLTQTAKRVAKGDLKARSQLERTDELGELSATFDKMLPQLQKHLDVMEAMDLASQAQRRLCPTEPVITPSLEAAGALAVCDILGGDLHYITKDRQNRIKVAVADVSGHGPAVGLLMALTKAYLTSVAKRSPRQVLEAMNQLLEKDLKEDAFVTLSLVNVNANGQMAGSSAGHPPPFLWDGKSLRALPAGGVPLGAVSDFTYPANKMPMLKGGNILVLMSDGIFELKHKSGERFIHKGLPQCLAKHHSLAIDKLCQKILRAAAFDDSDDKTIVLVRFRKN